MNSLLIVDGNSIASRAYYIKKNYFFSLIDKIIIAQNHRWPTIDGMVVVFDDPYTNSWRKELYSAYKGQRETDLGKRVFIDNLYEAALSLGLAVIRYPEADDVIATLSTLDLAEHKIIYSGDKDMFALLRDKVHLVGFEKMTIDDKTTWQKVIYDRADVADKFGSTPQQVMDYKALAGDKSDNIPGVKGIGDKIARELLEQYGSLAGIYDSLGFIRPAVRSKLEKYEELARISQQLARMDFEVELTLDMKKVAFTATPNARSVWATAVLS